MASTPMWRRAQNYLQTNPKATARQLQEALGCTKLSAIRFVTRWKQDQTARGQIDNVISLPKPNSKGRVAFEDLPPSSRASVVQRMNGILTYMDLTNTRLIEKHAEMSTLQHSQLANALASAMRALRELTDTYPGLSVIVSTEDADTSKAAAIARDLESVDDWLGTA